MKENLKNTLENIGLEAGIIEEIMAIGRLKNVKEGNYVITPDSTSKEIPLVLSGLLKVTNQDDKKDNEVFLYFLESGETCAMSITCCMEDKRNVFNVMAEEDSSLWMIPTTYLDSWIVKYPSFRRFVFQSYQLRFDELLSSIESIAFSKMDQRLLKYLLDTQQATGSYEIRKTHEQIARELNTSRVVVSRLLKKLEGNGQINQKRHLIEIL